MLPLTILYLIILLRTGFSVSKLNILNIEVKGKSVLSLLQQNTVQSTVPQPPLKTQIQTDCDVVQMGNHVDVAEEIIILHHHLTLIWRYFI